VKFIESEVPNKPVHQPAQKIKCLPHLVFLCRIKAKLHNAEHYSTFITISE